MKILHIISSANPKAGGPIEGITQLNAYFKAHPEHDITSEVMCLDSPNNSFIENANMVIHAIGPSTSSYGYCKQLIPWLLNNANKYDAIFIRGIWQYHSFGTWRVLKKLNIPYYVFTHGMLDPWFKKNYPLKHLKKWLYWPWAEYRVLRDAKAVLFTCEEEMRLAPQSFWLYKANGKVINYGTNLPPQDSENLKKIFLKQHPELADKRLIIFLSRIHEKKGCDILIEAFSKVVHLDNKLHLILAGPDSNGLKIKLEKQAKSLNIANKITWTGMLQGEDKWAAYYASEVFILPSHQENFGIVVAEALGCGLPVLITNKVNIWREIEADGAGLVAEDTVEGTEWLLTNWLSLSSDEKEKMAEQAKLTFTYRFTIKAMAEILLDLTK